MSRGSSTFDGRESGHLLRGMLVLAGPVFLEESLSLAVGYTDWWLAGHYLPGDQTFAAMSLMAYLLWLLPSLFAALAIGVTAVVSRRMGEGRIDEANRAVHQALVTGTAIALFSLVASQLLADAFPWWLQLQGESAELATRYFRIVAWVLPLIMIEQVLIAALRGAGDTFTGMMAKMLVVLVNIVASAGLVSGWGPFPKLGWEGLAIGTATGHATAATLLAIVFVRGRSGLKFRRSLLLWSGGVQRLLWRIGAPGGIDMLLILGFQFTFIGIVYRLGDLAAASHGLAVQIEALGYLPGSAFQVAAATMAGQFLGAANPNAARRAVFMCWGTGSLVIMTASLVFSFGGTQVARSFVADPDSPVVSAAAGLLVIVAAGMPALSLVMIGAGALRGAGDTRWPLFATLIGFTLIRLPLAVYFAWPPSEAWPWTLGLGVEGAWWAMVVDLWIRAALIGARLLHGGWQHVSLKA